MITFLYIEPPTQILPINGLHEIYLIFSKITLIYTLIKISSYLIIVNITQKNLWLSKIVYHKHLYKSVRL